MCPPNIQLSIGRADNPESCQFIASQRKKTLFPLSTAKRNIVRSLFLLVIFAVCICGTSSSLVAAEVLDQLDPNELSLEQLIHIRVDSVTGASRYEQKVTQAPASISILTADEIKKFGYRTLADVLRSVRGLYVSYDRNYSNFGIRGFSRPGDFNTRILLLVNGHRMNDNLYDSALIGTEAMVDVDLIERIEVIRGPSSSIYGNSAFFGVINVITRAGRQIDGAEASAEAGAYNSYKGRFTFGKQFTNGLEMVVSGSLFETDGRKQLYYPEFDQRISTTPGAANNGVARNADDETAYNLLTTLTYKDLTLTGAYSRREKHVPTASFGTVFNDGRERTTDERFYLDLKYNHSFADDLELMARGYYDYYGYRADYPFNYATSGPPFIVLNHDDNYGDGVGTEVQLTKKLWDRHTVIVGGEFRRDLDLYQSNFSGNPKTYNFLDNRDRWSVGGYAQGELVILTNLLLNAGVRYDEYSNFGGTANPRVGLIFSPWETTTFKLLYGQAYRAPNAYELYQASPFYSKVNPFLRPETIHTYEAVYEQYLPLNHRMSLSGYYYEVDDLISQRVDPSDGLLVFQNISSVTAKGAEFEVEGHYTRGLMARVSYAIQRADDGRTGIELNNSPRHLIKANLIAPIYKEKVYAGLEAQYTSGLKTLAGNRTSGFFVMNATVYSQKIVKNLDVSATIYNLFDERYAYPGSTGHYQDVIPQDGRSFRIKLTYKF